MLVSLKKSIKKGNLVWQHRNINACLHTFRGLREIVKERLLASLFFYYLVILLLYSSTTLSFFYYRVIQPCSTLLSFRPVHDVAELADGSTGCGEMVVWWVFICLDLQCEKVSCTYGREKILDQT